MASSSRTEKRCLYEILDVNKESSPEEIRSSYRRLALQRHPDKLIKAGYSDATGLVRTGNNTDQQRQDSAVFFAPGQRRMARDVAHILGISAKPEAIDPDTQALANNTGEGAAGHETDVVVITGLDQSP